MEQLHQIHQLIQLTVEGVVTLSYTNSEGTEFTGKTIPFSVGVTGLGDLTSRFSRRSWSWFNLCWRMF